jgi:hypothetical protein
MEHAAGRDGATRDREGGKTSMAMQKQDGLRAMEPLDLRADGDIVIPSPMKVLIGINVLFNCCHYT